MGRILIAALIALALIALGFSFVHHYTSFFRHSFARLTLKVKLMEILIPIASGGLLLTATLILWNHLTRHSKRVKYLSETQKQELEHVKQLIKTHPKNYASLFEERILIDLNTIIIEKSAINALMLAQKLSVILHEIEDKPIRSVIINFVCTVRIFHSDKEQLEAVGNLALISTTLDISVLQVLKKKIGIQTGHFHEKHFKALLEEKELTDLLNDS